MDPKEAADAIKKLKPQKTFSEFGATVRVTDVSIGSTWHFGNFGGGDFTFTADKDSQIVAIGFDFSSKSKTPDLPCVYAYLRFGDAIEFRRASILELQFRRWDSFGTSLGNSTDVGNDFAKSETVKFSAGGQVETGSLAAATLYILFAKVPTLTRTEDRFAKPPVQYTGECSAPVALSYPELVSRFDVAEIRPPRAY